MSAARKSKPAGPAPIIRLGTASPTPETVVMLPGSQIPLLRLELPPGLRGQARERVARRQLADRTGLAPDELSLRPFLPQGLQPPPGTTRQKWRQTGSADHWTQVFAGDSQWLQGLANLTCRAVLPDYLTLPTATGIWSLAPGQISPDSPVLMARLGPEDGFTARTTVAIAMLRQALEATAPPHSIPGAILWEGPDDSPLFTEIKALANNHGIALITTPEAARPLDLPVPQIFAHGELGCDLRHNPMAARARLAATILPWRWPLLAGCLAAGLWAAGELTQLSQLQTQITAQELRNQTLVKTHFIPEGPVLDARLQISRALTALRHKSATTAKDTNPLAVTARMADVVMQAGLRPDLLSYRGSEGLLLALRLKDFAAADQLATALQETGLAATLTDSRVNEAESGVQAEFVITGFTTPHPESEQ